MGCPAPVGALDSLRSGSGVPPLPLWAHGEPAAMPALFFSSARMLARDAVVALGTPGGPAPGLTTPARWHLLS
jgi:hypothetical protein